MFQIESCASRSKSATYQRKGRLLRFQANSTATSDAWALKLGNNAWYDSELIATKFEAKPFSNEMQYLKAMCRPILIGRSSILDNRFEDFFSNLPL